MKFFDVITGKDLNLINHARGTTADEAHHALAVTDISVAFTEAINNAEGVRETTIPAVGRAIKFLSSRVASLSMEQVDKKTGVADGTTPKILDRPESHRTYYQTLIRIVESMLYYGNAYLWIRERDTRGNVTSVYVLDPRQVMVTWDISGLFPVYTWTKPNSGPRRLEAGTEIIHIANNYWGDGLYGIGPIQAYQLSLLGVKAEADLYRRMMLSDATPTGLLKNPGKGDTEKAKAIQDAWVDRYGGTTKRPAVLYEGWEFQQLSINPVDAQFLESRMFSIQEIGRMFDLHGYWLNVVSGDSLTYSTTEGLFRDLLTTTLEPLYLSPIESAFSELIPRNKIARFNVNEVLRTDQSARYSAYATGIASGFLEPNEARKEENLPPLPGNPKPKDNPEVAPE